MKESQLQTYAHPDLGDLRITLIDNEPWFLAGQACRCLGIKDSSTAVAQLEERMRAAEIPDKVSNRISICYEGQRRQVQIVNEQGLYELAFGSRKQKAIKFRAWVTGEVLPSLRKHGEYRMGEKLIRRTMTDSIKEKIVDKTENSNEKKFAYSNYTRLINKVLGLPNKNNKDDFSPETLERLAHMENLVQILIDEGKGYDEIKDFISRVVA